MQQHASFEFPDLHRALDLIGQALDGKASIRPAPIVEADGVRAIVEMGGGTCHQLRLRAWPGELDADAAEGRPLVSLPATPATVWVLRRGTRAVREELRKAGLSFVDLSGVVHLDLPGLIVDRSDLGGASLRSHGRRLIDPFADRSSQVVRALLSGPTERVWGVRELAATAGVSPATASRAVRELAAEGVLEVERQGRSSRIRSSRPEQLFERWTQEYDWGRNVRVSFQAPVGDPVKFLPRLKEPLAARRWAFSLHAGASLVAPHATWERIHLYVDLEDAAQARALGRSAGWSPAEEGPVVMMIPHYRDSVWWRLDRVRGLPVVHVVQLVLDLWHYPLRGLEQARHLVETRLEKLWHGPTSD